MSPPPADTSPTNYGIGRDVVLPFALTRCTFLLLARLSDFIRIGDWSPGSRGWAYTPTWFIDVWGRWDTGLYLRIALEGYQRDALNGVNKIAFYPLYPKLIAAILAVFPPRLRNDATAITVGVILSNAFAIAALAVLFQHVRARFADAALAKRTILYLLAFPTAFYLSCVYTESLFLLLAVTSYHLAWRGHWGRAGVTGALLALTRPTGVLMSPVFLSLWFEKRARHEPQRFGLRGVLAVLLIPAGWAAWAGYCWHLTGDPLVVFHVQSAWGRGLKAPWDTLLSPTNPTSLDGFDAVVTLFFLAAGLALLRWPRSLSYSVFTLLCVASYLFTGQLYSSSRIVFVAFPVFILLAHLGRALALERAYLFLSVTFQAFFVAAWSRMYWIQ